MHVNDQEPEAKCRRKSDEGLEIGNQVTVDEGILLSQTTNESARVAALSCPPPCDIHINSGKQRAENAQGDEELDFQANSKILLR